MRPSSLLDVQDTYTAYCLDEAVTRFAEFIVEELDSIKHRNDRMLEHLRLRKLHQLLGLKLPTTQAFAKPQPTVRR